MNVETQSDKHCRESYISVYGICIFIVTQYWDINGNYLPAFIEHRGIWDEDIVPHIQEMTDKAVETFNLFNLDMGEKHQ